MTQLCPACEQWLLYVNGSWRHQYTDQAYACYEKRAVMGGTPYEEPESVMNYLTSLVTQV